MFAFLLSGWVSGKVKVVSSLIIIIIFSGAAAHRSMYLAFCVQILYWITINGNIKALYRPLAAVFIGFIVIIFTDFGNVIMSKFIDSYSGGDGNTESRLFYYKSIFINSFEDFFGVGFGEYFKYGLDSKGESVSYALQHNSYLSYLYFLGWVPFVFVVYFTFKLFSRGVNVNADSKVYLTVLVGMSFFSILNVYLEQPTFGILYWAVFGIVLGDFRQYKAIRH
ncbi:O-antigen ligase family protein [Neptunomonas japonica]|nr:O-antigen ligase family protein [Neptunomonas japonica]